MDIKKLNELVGALKEMHKISTMQTAAFYKLIQEENDLPYPSCEAEVTPFIIQRTKIWRETWITNQLEWIIEELKTLADD